MTCVEIFTGAGGLAKGLELAGAEHVAFVEWNKDACATLRQNYDQRLVFEGDVRDFAFSDYQGVDLIAGGPPCQPFSLGGKAGGASDKRDMFPAAIAAIRAIMPKAFIFENVKGLLRQSFAEYFQYIILQLSYPEIQNQSADWREHLRELKNAQAGGVHTSIKYHVNYQLVNAADYGVPQKRERVIIVGFREDIASQWSFPSPSHSEDALLWDKYVTGAYWQKHQTAGRVAPDSNDQIKKHLIEKYGFWPPALKPWQTMRDALNGLDAPKGSGEHALRSGAKPYPGHTGSDIDEPSKAIKAGGHGVPGGENMIRFADGTVRYLSVLETKRIQTFPDNYTVTGSWTEAMRQLGNAVPVRLAYVVGSSVIAALNNATTATVAAS